MAVKKHTALSAESRSPGSNTRRRPTWSESLPNRSSDAITPAAYVAKITVIISSENPNCWRYSPYSGVGSVVPSIATASANAAAAKPSLGPKRSWGAVVVLCRAGLIPSLRWAGPGSTSPARARR